jgi:hypothetical protein
VTAPSTFPSGTVSAPAGDALLTGDVLAHLDAQRASASTLLHVVLEQGKAIRARDVHEVVLQAGRLQAELQRRRQIELDRSHLLERAAVRLRIASGAVTLESLTALMDPAAATTARTRSAELRGMLDEIQREHVVNRALMTQELAFLDHLLRLVDLDGSGAYGSKAARPSSQAATSVGARRVLDMQA